MCFMKNKILAVFFAALVLPSGNGFNLYGSDKKMHNIYGENCPPAQLVQNILSKPAPENWRSSGITRELYLDILERIVRVAAPWVNEKGAVIDPVLKYEHAQTSSRFASSCAVLIYFGRGNEYKETLYRVMDYCCNALKQPDSVERSPDFWMRELVTAYRCLKDIAPAERLAQWKNDLSQVIPEKNYKKVSPDPAKRREMHNWAVYAAAGESMRQSAGIGGKNGELWGERFFDEYMQQQLWRFNEYGMYRDPLDPITYDITTRLQLEAALAAGYNGIWRSGLRKILDDAMYATVLFMPPSGEVPFGGRTSQFYFREGIISALCELAAGRCKEKDPRLAGAFKRQAHLSAAAVKRGMLKNDGKLFHLKNFFPPESLHGCDMYGHYSVYTLLAGSVFAQAALFADDTIPETPAVAEIGGYAWGLPNNFYKFFCNQNGNYLEFDLKAHPSHDACGLGRIIMPDLPWGLLPVMPFACNPHYRIDEKLPPNKFHSAIAPEWLDENGKVRRLADCTEQIGQYSQQAPGVWQVVYQAWGATVTYTADLRRKNQLVLQIKLSGNVKNPAMIIPVLEFDGMNKPRLTLSGSGFTAVMNGKTLQCSGNGGSTAIDGKTVNRTGLYKRVKIPFTNSDTLTLDIAVKP